MIGAARTNVIGGMSMTDEPDLAAPMLPPDGTARQAVAALRGYVYQIYRSLHAWLALRQDEILLLEVAEDYTRLARGEIDVFQVKAQQKPATLRDLGVVKAIAAFWALQAVNRDSSVRMTYLTTSPIGRERDLTFPGGAPGLSHWRDVARGGSDVTPLRHALLSLSLPDTMKSWIGSADPEQFRELLLRRIRWECGEVGLDKVGQVILDRLADLSRPMGFMPSDAGRVRDALLHAVIECVTGTTERRLTHAQLLRLVEDSTSVRMPLSVLRQAAGFSPRQPGGGGVGHHTALIACPTVPLPVRATGRPALVDDLRDRLSGTGALWLYGSSGVGKTVLAQLVATQHVRPWFILQLRDCAGPELDDRLAAAFSVLGSGRIGGLILDDLPHAQLLNARIRLSAIGEEGRAADALVIVTSSRPPPPTIAECLGDGRPDVSRAPYLTVADVAAMVTTAGGDAGFWAAVIHAFCGGGHPQLVDARIAGLSSRKWPVGEVMAGIGTIPAPAEIDAQRDAVRAKLLDELPDGASNLLYRLSLIDGGFDRSMALSVAGADPKIRRPGDALDMLVGPWVEARGDRRYAVSPLVDDVGVEALDEEEMHGVDMALVDDLIARNPFPGEYAAHLLVHALRSGRADGISHLSMMILSEMAHDDAAARAIAGEVAFLATSAAYDDRPFLPANPSASMMMRIAQLKVAALARPGRLLTIARRLLRESREMAAATERGRALPAALCAVLIEPDLPVRAREWIGWLEELRDSSRDLEVDRLPFQATGQAPLPGTEGWTYLQHLFALRATNLRDLRDLREMIDELQRLGLSVATPYFEVLDDPTNVTHRCVQGCWTRTIEAAASEPRKVAEELEALQLLAEASKRHALAVECGCARVVVLDEHVGDAVAAQTAMDPLLATARSERLVDRTHVGLLYRRGRYAACVRLTRRIAEGTRLEEGIETALALRTGAIGASFIGDHGTAEELFHDARWALPCFGATASAMGVGLLADAARAAWDRDARRASINLLVQAVIGSEAIDPNAGPLARWIVKALAHLILQMRANSQALGPETESLALPYGFCSRLEPPPEIMDQPAASTTGLWYLLAALEADLGEELGIFDALRHRTATGRYDFYETAFAGIFMARHLRRLDVEGFIAHLPEFLYWAGYAVIRRELLPAADSFTESRVIPPMAGDVDWEVQPFRGLAMEAVVAFGIAAAMRHSPRLADALASGLESIGARFAASWLMPSDDQLQSETDIFRKATWAAGRLNDPTDRDPDMSYLASVHIWSWLTQSLFGGSVEDAVARRVSLCWLEIADKQRFRLRFPSTNVPSIVEAAGHPVRTGRRLLADIILATESAVNHRLSGELRSKLRACAGEIDPGSEPARVRLSTSTP
ncbi:hypothetical protein ASF41_12585 [Methylobacterium sp. Leaf111]|nr:hypothetical protein ASF41_12585 [Methylobacterium sp. Leaf111]